jgi:hypothetical protein
MTGKIKALRIRHLMGTPMRSPLIMKGIGAGILKRLLAPFTESKIPSIDELWNDKRRVKTAARLAPFR